MCFIWNNEEGINEAESLVGGPPVINNVSAWSEERFKETGTTLCLFWEVFNPLRCTIKVKRLLNNTVGPF